MIGEFEYDTTFVESINSSSETTRNPLNPFPEISMVFIYIFLFLMSIILMNLLVRLFRYLTFIFWHIYFCICFYYYIDTDEIPGFFQRQKFGIQWRYNFYPSHEKIPRLSWQLQSITASFHRCLYNKQNITCPLVDTNFIFSCSTRYLTRSLIKFYLCASMHFILSSSVQLDISKTKFVSTRGHGISFISPLTAPCKHSLLLSSSWSRRRNGGSVWIESIFWSSRNPNFYTGQSCFLSWNWVCARACVDWCS